MLINAPLHKCKKIMYALKKTFSLLTTIVISEDLWRKLR